MSEDIRGRPSEQGAPQAAQLTAGRELDALVAERVMEWAIKLPLYTPCVVGDEDDLWENSERRWYTTEIPPRPIRNQPVPRFGTDISAAWQVVEKMGERWAVFVSYFPGRPVAKRWQCEMDHDENTAVLVDADSAPLAICLAALKACDELRASANHSAQPAKSDDPAVHRGDKD